MKTISIHQPNFCPRASFFEKVREADVFVILGHVQYPKGKYVSRFGVGDKWYSMRINRGLEPIFKKRYIDFQVDWHKLVNKFPQLNVFSNCINESVLLTNSEIIRLACEILNIDTIILHDYPTELKGTERLVDICKTYGATKYLSGPSGKNYLDLKLFEQAGIEVEFQETKDIRPLVELI